MLLYYIDVIYTVCLHVCVYNMCVCVFTTCVRVQHVCVCLQHMHVNVLGTQAFAALIDTIIKTQLLLVLQGN